MKAIWQLSAKTTALKRSIALFKHARGQDISQGGTWTYLSRLISAESPRYLVDVGAYDGVLSSNSYAFIQSGWKAVLIEPLPGPFELLARTYKENGNVVCINKACSNTIGTQKLFLGAAGKLGMTATMCTDDNEWFRRHRSVKFTEVQVDTLTNILAQHASPKDFTLLTIDAEGMDYEVCLGLDFRFFAPRIIVTEEYLWNPEKHRAKCELLEKNGYSILTKLGSNTVWKLN